MNHCSKNSDRNKALTINPVPGPPASSTERGADNADAAEYLICLQTDTLFALEIMSVKEIIQYGQLTAVPLMPDYLRGLINVRGTVVPVIDLSARFGHGIAAVGKQTSIVIVETYQDGESHELGIMVDAVFAVLAIEHDRIEPPPAFGTCVRRDFIAGISKINDRFVIILDVAQTFSFTELAEISA